MTELTEEVFANAAKNVFEEYIREGLSVQTDDAESIASEIVQHLCSIKLGEAKRTHQRTKNGLPEPLMEAVTIENGGRDGAVTSKPINLVLDVERATYTGAGTVFTVASLTAQPWLLPFGILLGIKAYKQLHQILIKRQDAVVLMAIWKYAGRHELQSDTAFTKAVELFGQYEMPLIDRTQFEDSVDRLIKLQCIHQKDGKLQVIEEIRLIS